MGLQPYSSVNQSIREGVVQCNIVIVTSSSREEFPCGDAARGVVIRSMQGVEVETLGIQEDLLTKRSPYD